MRRADNLTTSHADCLESWESQLPGTLRPPQACNGIALPFTDTHDTKIGQVVYYMNTAQ